MPLPLLESLKAADAGSRRDDVVAGVITAILLVPQAMAYAHLAGLPAQAGLVASIVPPVIYAVFGSSRSLAVGPVAVAALMVAHALADFAADDRALWSVGAMILAAEAGAVLLLMRLFRLGSLVHFVSHPVLYGFTSGAALLIIVSQLPLLLGLSIPRAEAGHTLVAISQQWPGSDGLTLGLALVSIVILLLSRRPLQMLLVRLGVPAGPAGLASKAMPLSVVLGALLLVGLLPPEQRQGLQLVGEIGRGIPLPDWAALWSSGWIELAPSAALIALVGYVESIAVARVLGHRRRQKVDADQELTALGLANIGAAVVGTMPVAGGFSRSVVNFEAGARTQVAALITSALVAMVAVFFTQVFETLPKAVLAAIIVVAVAQLVDWKSARAVFAYDRGDGATLVVTMLGVLIFGIDAGLVLGVLLAIALYLRKTSVPHIAIMGRVPGTEHFRNVNRHQVECTPGLLIARVDENLYFANIAMVEDFVEQALQARAVQEPPVRALLLVMSAVSAIDASAEEALLHWEESLAERGVELHFAEVKGPVWDQVAPSPLGQRMAGRVHLSTHTAVQSLAPHCAAEGAPELSKS
nr:sulfate permease [Oceanococcus sp. HetDA_MAG_MS8]